MFTHRLKRFWSLQGEFLWGKLWQRAWNLTIIFEALLAVAMVWGSSGRLSAKGIGFDGALEVVGGTYRMFREGSHQLVLRVGARSIDQAAHEVRVKFRTEDIFGRPVLGPDELTLALPADGAQTETEMPFEAGFGYYSLHAEFDDGVTRVTKWSDLGVIPPPFPGPRPNSLFASNTSELKQGEDLDFLQTIGMKVERAHFTSLVETSDPNWAVTFPAGQAVPLSFSKQDTNWESTKFHDLWVLPIAGYALMGGGKFDRTDLATKLGMYGPPGDEDRFVNTWETILRRYPEITTYEFWNEPWIFEWSWAGTPSDYRRLQKDWSTMALGVNPHYHILAGNSTMFVRDNIQPYPECWRGLISGVTEHPYTRSVGEANFRAGDNLRSIDDIVLTARQMGLPYALLTEGGTNYQSAGPAVEQRPFNNLENASKMVQYYVTTALAGAYMGNAQWNIGYGPDWTCSNTAFAVMAHFLEDRVPLADIWPQEELLWGGIFANPKCATEAVKELPRASELMARWNVDVPPDRARDATKVAVVWSLTGLSNRQLDQQGELLISDASGLRAFDVTGREILPVDGHFLLPFTQIPVYVTTENLSVIELRDRIAGGMIQHVTPVNLYAFSLAHSADRKQSLSVRVENQLNRPVKGVLTLRMNNSPDQASSHFAIEAGGLVEVQVSWPAMAESAENQYPITLIAKLEKDGSQSSDPEYPPVIRDQMIAVAKFAKRTIKMSGSLDDWKGITPVMMDSQQFEDGRDPTNSLLNPQLEQSPGMTGHPQIVARVYTAYDDTNVYLGAVVHEDQFRCSAGEPFILGPKNSKITLPFKEGMPDGLQYITHCGDVFQFSFGFRDRVPGIGRQMGDPWAWKGCFYDTDYSFVAHKSTDGDQLIRIWGPDNSRQDGYQTEAVPGIDPCGVGRSWSSVTKARS